MTRLITIKRSYTVTKTNDRGQTTSERYVGYFPCKINAGVPLDHKMCK